MKDKLPETLDELMAACLKVSKRKRVRKWKAKSVQVSSMKCKKHEEDPICRSWTYCTFVCSQYATCNAENKEEPWTVCISCGSKFHSDSFTTNICYDCAIRLTE